MSMIPDAVEQLRIAAKALLEHGEEGEASQCHAIADMLSQEARWIAVADAEPGDGRHIIYAPSADPDKPFISIAWWNTEERHWELIPSVWADAVTHWMNVPTPPE